MPRNVKIPTLLHWENLRRAELRNASEDPLVRMASLEEDLNQAKEPWIIMGPYLQNETGVKIDPQDFFWVKHHTVKSSRYPEIRIGHKIYRLHQLIMPLFGNGWVDHKNRNKLDNRRCNLRAANPSQSGVNRGLGTKKSSIFRGVCRAQRSKKWRATISIGGKGKLIGFSDSETGAALMYNEMAVKIFGEFAQLNQVT